MGRSLVISQIQHSATCTLGRAHDSLIPALRLFVQLAEYE
jgi:hypothetical protein